MNLKRVISFLLSACMISAVPISISAVEKEQMINLITYDFTKTGWNTEHEVGITYTNWQDGFYIAAKPIAPPPPVPVPPPTTTMPTLPPIMVLTPITQAFTFSEDVSIEISGHNAIGTGTLTETYEVKKGEPIKFVVGGTSYGGEVNMAKWADSKINSLKISSKVKNARNEGKPYTFELLARHDSEQRLSNYPIYVTAVEPEPLYTMFFGGFFIGGTTAPLRPVPLLTGSPEGKYTTAEDYGIEMDFTKDDEPLKFNDIKANLGYALVNDIGDKRGTEIVMTFRPEEKLGEVPSPGIDSPALDFGEIEAQMKDLAIAPARMGEFNHLIQGAAKIEDNKAIFNWDEIVDSSGLYINSIGLIDDIVIGHKDQKDGGNEDAPKLVLEKIEVKIPSMTFNDLSAGEGMAELESEVR